MKTLFNILLVSICFSVDAQEFYFSSKPFKLDETPVSEGNTFTDDQYVYGLVVIDKPISQIDIETKTYIRENREKYKVGSVTLLYKPGLFMDGSWVSCPLVENGDKSYLFLPILPNPDEAYYLWEHPDGFRDALEPMTTLGKKVSLFLQCDALPECTFLKTVKITKKGNLTKEIISERDDLIRDGENMNKDWERGNQAEQNARFTYDEIVPIVKTKHYSPGSYIDIDFIIKKEGDPDYKAKYLFGIYKRYKGFEITLEGITQTESGEFYIQNYPYAKDPGTVSRLTFTNKYNNNCTATIEFPIDYQGDQYINVSGSTGYKGRDGRSSKNGSMPTDGKEGGDGENGTNIHVYIKEYKPGYVIVKAEAPGYNPIFRIVSATNGHLTVMSNGGRAGLGGYYGQGDSSYGIEDAEVGRGGDGGNGGQITIHLDKKISIFRSRVKTENKGGSSWGYVNYKWSFGESGSDGPEPTFIIEDVSF